MNVLKINIRLILFYISLYVFAGQQSFGQSVKDLENAVTTGSQFEEAQVLLDGNYKPLEEGNVLAGEPGVFILKKNEIFSLGAVADTGFSNNPGRTLDTNTNDAYYASLAVSAGVNTRIAGQYDTGFNLVASAIEYDRSDAPSNRNFVGNTYIGRAFMEGAFYISANATVGLTADNKFNRSTAFYATGVNISKIWNLSDKLFLRPAVSISRQWSGQSEQNNYASSVSTSLIWSIAPKWFVRGQLSYTYRTFDNFYEDVTFVKRVDHLIRAGINLSRQITENTNVSASLEFTKQNSSFFISEYTALDGGINIKFAKRF